MLKQNIYLICFYVPESHLEQVKNSLFQAGAGNLGNYSCCCWQTKGIGQYRPEEGSNPYLGKLSQTETVEEYKVELICTETNITQVVAALKANHPYETPAYQVIKIDDF